LGLKKQFEDYCGDPSVEDISALEVRCCRVSRAFPVSINCHEFQSRLPDQATGVNSEF
jgi:hypothetical protein